MVVIVSPWLPRCPSSGPYVASGFSRTSAFARSAHLSACEVCRGTGQKACTTHDRKTPLPDVWLKPDATENQHIRTKETVRPIARQSEAVRLGRRVNHR